VLLGGAGTFVALNATNLDGPMYKNRFAAAFTFSGCMTTDMPFLYQCVGNDYVPIMMFAGQRDCLCYESLEQKLYSLIQSTPRYWVNILGGTHCGYMDGPTIP